MKKFYIFFSLSITLLLALSAGAQKPVKDLKPTVIVISIDGFRADYFEKFQPPTIKQARAGWCAGEMDDSIVSDQDFSESLHYRDRALS